MIFSESTNTQAFLKAGIMGFAGSGKTRTATEIATGLHAVLRERSLAGGSEPIFFLDTETGADWVRPLIINRTGIKPQVAKTRAFADLVPAVREAEKSKGILIIDSITHFWRELTDSYAKQKKRAHGLRIDDWAVLKGMWGQFTDIFVNSNCHILMCGRAGYEYEFFDNDGKKEMEKTGIKMKAETETGYEPSILFLMERHQDISTDPISVWRTAVVLKDRAELLDGKVFRNPTFKDFLPHINFLNLGGEQMGVDTTRNSESMIVPDDKEWKYLQQQKEITLDEIQTVLVKHYPGQTKDDKTAKIALLEKHLGSGSWERVKSMKLEDLRDGYHNLHRELESTLPPPSDADIPFGYPAEELGATVPQ